MIAYSKAPDGVKTPFGFTYDVGDAALAKNQVFIKAVAHTTLTAKTPYKIYADEYGFLTCAMSTAKSQFYVGIAEASTASGEVGRFQIGGLCEDVITASLSVSVGHAFAISDGAVTDCGEDFSMRADQFGICYTASTSSTTQDIVLIPRMLTTSDCLEIFGSGNEFAVSAANVASAKADAKIMQYYVDSQATSGTTRLWYGKLYLSGGAGGETIRAYTTVISNTPADTCNGAHISLGFGTSVGNITGLGTAVRAAIMIPARALTGTVCAVLAELYCTATTSTTSGILACYGYSVAGDGTGVGLTAKAGYAMYFDSGCVDNSAGIIDGDKSSISGVGCIKIYIQGVGARYILWGT